jgi:hypothetical protein
MDNHDKLEVKAWKRFNLDNKYQRSLAGIVIKGKKWKISLDVS